MFSSDGYVHFTEWHARLKHHTFTLHPAKSDLIANQKHHDLKFVTKCALRKSTRVVRT